MILSIQTLRAYIMRPKMNFLKFIIYIIEIIFIKFYI
jgi:hypothetical protein